MLTLLTHALLTFLAISATVSTVFLVSVELFGTRDCNGPAIRARRAAQRATLAGRQAY